MALELETPELALFTTSPYHVPLEKILQNTMPSTTLGAVSDTKATEQEKLAIIHKTQNFKKLFVVG